MADTTPNWEKEIEILKINQDFYKNYFDWIVKIFIVYFTIVGALFGFIIKSEDASVIAFLFLTIFLASLVFIYASILIKTWLRRYRKGIKKLTEELNYDLDHLLYPARKGSTLIILCCSIILTITVFMFLKLYFDNYQWLRYLLM
jgi:hypothetical protein